MIHQTAPAKLNLVLRVGPRRGDGMHEICSLLVPLDLADELTAQRADRDEVVCPGVDGENLASRALAAFRRAVPDAPAGVRVQIDKRVPVAAGLGGGSSNAAATLLAANKLAGQPLSMDDLRRLAAGLGSDVPSLVEPRSVLVSGAGETVEAVPLPELWFVLLYRGPGLLTAEVYAEHDRIGGGRTRLDPDSIRGLAGAPVERLAGSMENDLEAAALSLRPDLGEVLETLGDRGALGARISGSGPTTFGVFAGRENAENAAAGFKDAMIARSR